uniref:Uncharacterized protein n=1 Tax=Salix viminalis TaxID=40686 RepID=A0A6N2KGB2_SALVM
MVIFFSTGTLQSYHYFNLTIGRQKTSLDCNSYVRMGWYWNWNFLLPGENARTNAILIPPFVKQLLPELVPDEVNLLSVQHWETKNKRTGLQVEAKFHRPCLGDAQCL